MASLRRPIAKRHAEYYLTNAPSLVVLLVVNAMAFLVGVLYYVETLSSVPTFLWPLYGDSPTAIALATLSLATLLPTLGHPLDNVPQNRPLAYLHTLAFVWLFKYGIWTFIALNRRIDLYIGFDVASLYAYWFILFTHLLFVVQAFLIVHYGRTTRGALVGALALLLTNDLFDYGFGYHPPIRYDPGIVLATVTVGLSIVTVAVAAWAFDQLDE
ncbi:DUF1405 domain-containing protein [Halalkalirubrum salinum]|uniref:DUF1405 domain-containing protein n=1 Tax=Halalkalirubrum salinum TaxID=2563889 RepID=UPI0010FAE479|nr:DUF1405 domain-containing protein [Halalkalirubrum salinum]